MQHNAADPAKKVKGRPKWAFVENMGSSLALIHKQNPDDLNFVLALLQLAGSSIINYFTSFFSSGNVQAADPRLAERATMKHLDLVKRLNELDDERKKVNKRIYTAQDSNQVPDPADINEKARIQKDINFYYFGPDTASIKLNELLADYTAEVAQLRTRKTEVEERINKIKEENKAQKKAGSNQPPKVIDPKDEALVEAITNDIDTNMVKMVTLVQENIREHARRRVDTFLYLCIALYKTNMTVSYIPRAPIQIGEGSKVIGTEACHAALVKQIVLEKAAPSTTVLADSIDKVKDALQMFINIFKPGEKSAPDPKLANAAPATISEMEQRIIDANKKSSESSWLEELYQLASDKFSSKDAPPAAQNNSKPITNTTVNVDTKEDKKDVRPLAEIIKEFEYKNSYLEELLNITTDLPEVVNDFDGLLEGKFGKVSPFIQVGVTILNRVSNGELHPLKAMNEFGEIANLFFSSMNYSYFVSENISSLLAFKKSAELVCQYEREGTFAAYYPKSTIISEDYVCLMLGLKSMTMFEKAATFFNYIGFVDDRIMEIQRTILTADPMRVKMPEHKAAYAKEKKGTKSKVQSVQNSNNIQNKLSGP